MGPNIISNSDSLLRFCGGNRLKFSRTVGRNGWHKRHNRQSASQDVHDFTSKGRESCREEVRRSLCLLVSRLREQGEKLEDLEEGRSYLGY